MPTTERPDRADRSSLPTKPATERYLAVGLTRPVGGFGGRASLDELHRLIEAANAETVGEIDFQLRRVEPRHFVSRDRAQQLSALAAELRADGIAFDFALTPAQQNNLAELCKCKVIDRQAVILDIFAQRARTREGQLQVELAQLRYLLPRLRGYGVALSRLGGGIGIRGPGESMLETDRRVMGERIRRIEVSIGKVRRRRDTQGRERRRRGAPVVALIGYTNAGKSTLLNALAEAGAFVADQLFATLDPKASQFALPGGTLAILTDTVGFIHNLPTTLVAAFRATLEEIRHAALLVHLLDASSTELEREFAATQSLLGELELLEHPRLVVYNKLDLLEPHQPFQLALPDSLRSVAISAVTGEGLEKLGSKIEELLTKAHPTLDLLIPYRRTDLVDTLQREAQVLELKHEPEGTRLKVRCSARRAGQLKPYLVDAETT
jgi:GTP-binding protein HflX